MITTTANPAGELRPSAAEIKSVVDRYRRPSHARAIWQLTNTLLPYLFVWYLMARSISVSYWLMLPFAVIAAGLRVRIFIFMHDCGHGSFLRSQRANSIIGWVTGLLTFTPFQHWSWEHAMHHRTSGNLNRRGQGDIWTMTVEEYLASPWWRRVAYRLLRNPLILLVIAPTVQFVIRERFPTSGAGRRERRSVLLTDLGLVLMAVALCKLIGFSAWLQIELTLMFLAGAAGVWLFYVQHQFVDAYWARDEQWDYTEAALSGSSFYNLPGILRWFSGNIGFHHIHHLSPQIPNYHLRRCHNAEPRFARVPTLTLAASFKSATLRLWDEQHQRLIGFRLLAQRSRRL
ncbi:MAG: fatty acid desaturase [Steroidobacteraceae bacterium]